MDMPGSTNGNMVVSISMETGEITEEYVNGSEHLVHIKDDDMVKRGWYDKINSFLLEDDTVPIEIVQTIEEEDAL